MFDVICAGQAVLDCITRGKEDAPYRENVYRAEDIVLRTGGDAVNEAEALSGMGFRTAICCGLGNDIAGRIIEDDLMKAGVDKSRVERLVAGTPIANLTVREDGSRFSVNSGATRLEGYRINPKDLIGAKVVSFASLFRPPLEEPALVKELILTAKENYSVVCADTKLPLREGIGLEEISEVLPFIDYFFPNEKEAAYYSKKTTYREMAEVFHEYGIKNVIIKTGSEGCYVSNGENDFSIPALPVGEVKDTTGAGDHFVAGFISGILWEKSLRGCAVLGLQQAARAITRLGG